MVGTIKLHFEPEMFHYRPGTPFPSYVKIAGDVSPVTGLAFDRAAGEQSAYVKFRAVNYGSGDWTALIGWYSVVEISGNVMFGISVSCLTANTDVVAVGAQEFDTEDTEIASHLGTIATRPHDTLATVTHLDSVSENDWVSVRFSRKAAHVSDTLDDVIVVTSLDLSWSDT